MDLTLREEGKSYLLSDASYYKSKCKEIVGYVKDLKQENDTLKEALREAICIIHDYSDRTDAKINGCDIDTCIDNFNKLIEKPD
jgi:hypothetical protein